MLHETNPNVGEIDKNVGCHWATRCGSPNAQAGRETSCLRRNRVEGERTAEDGVNREGWCATKEGVNLWSRDRHTENLRMNQCTVVLVKKSKS